MKLGDLLDSVTLEGCVKLQCWETDTAPEVYFEGEVLAPVDLVPLMPYGDREVQYIFPYTVFTKAGLSPAICIELHKEET